MKDDYLWDRTGEPDGEIADLEKRLSVFKYRELSLKAKVNPGSRPVNPRSVNPRSANWTAIAAAVVGASILALGLWLALNRGVRQNHRDTGLRAGGSSNANPNQNSDGSVDKSRPKIAAPDDSDLNHAAPNRLTQNTRQPVVHRAPPRTPIRDTNRSGTDEHVRSNAVVAEVVNPLVDAETARHIEKAQTLLISFKNSAAVGEQASTEVAEDRVRCRAILSSNIVLRKSAEQRGNLPIQELLGSLEPFLLDIANLPDRPSAADVRDIQNRIRKNEILVALELYSPPALDGAF
jgi:hypothetical protein